MIWTTFYAVSAAGILFGFYAYAYATGERHGKRKADAQKFSEGYALAKMEWGDKCRQEGYNVGVDYGQHHPKRDHGRFVSPDVPTSH